MGVADSLKHAVKAALDAVTGHGAEVDLRCEGPVAPGATVTVHLTVTSTGGAVDAAAAVVDLHGEDDLDEGLLDRLTELLPGHADPHHTFAIADPFTLAPDQAKTFVGSFVLPELALNRVWLIRGRIRTPGSDPASAYRRLD